MHSEYDYAYEKREIHVSLLVCASSVSKRIYKKPATPVAYGEKKYKV